MVALAFVCTTLATPGCTSKSCTLVGCEDGVSVNFSYKEAGSYVFEVTVDGVKTTCTAAIPLPAERSNPCDTTGVTLMQVGTPARVADQSIGGLTIRSTNATNVALRITRDNRLVQEVSFAPSYSLNYPNGPDCDPYPCKWATYTLP